MIRRMLALSLVVIPFYEVILYFLIPGRTMPQFQDMRITKDFLVMVFSLAIGLSVLYRDGFKPCKIKWPMLFLLFLVWNIFKIPHATVPLEGTNINGIWNFWPAFQIIALFILFLGIVNLEDFSLGYNVDSIINMMLWSGTLMAGYMVLQKFGFDQIFMLTQEWSDRGIVAGIQPLSSVAGVIGNPSTTAPFLVMILPFAILFKRYWFLALMCLGVVLAESSFAIGGMILVLWIYGLRKMKNKISLYFYGAISLFLLVVLSFLVYKFAGHLLYDGGRFPMWREILKQSGPWMGMTGMGIGSFKFLFAMKNGNTWYQAHNDFLQLYWTCGIVGVGIVFMLLKDVFIRVFKNMTDYVFALGVSLIGLLFCASGNFVFQLGVYQFYTVVIIGLIYVLTKEVRYANQ